MRISPEAIIKLQAIVQEEHGTVLTDEQAQQMGLSVMRFVYAKELNKASTVTKEQDNGNGNQAVPGE